MNYKTMVNNAYNKYIKDWCEVRGCRPSHVDPEIGINGECYVCISEFERNEFQNEEYMERILSDTEFTLWQARQEFKEILLKKSDISNLSQAKSRRSFRLPEVRE